MKDPFYRRKGDMWQPTVWTRGPWSPDHQHGGPPAALTLREVEQQLDGFTIAGVDIDLLRPVPILPLRVEVEDLGGRRARRLVAELKGPDGKPLLRARVLALTDSQTTEAAVQEGPLQPGPEQGRAFDYPFFRVPENYAEAVDTRIVAGNHPGSRVGAWMRMRGALIEGEEPSPVQRVLTSADAGSGITAAIDPGHYTFVNPTLRLTLHRPLQGEWVGMDCSMWVGPSGVGSVRTTLSDPQGTIGIATQSLLVRAR